MLRPNHLPPPLLTLTTLPQETLTPHLLLQPSLHSLMYSESIFAINQQAAKVSSSLSTNPTIPLVEKEVNLKLLKGRTDKVLRDEAGRKKSVSVCSLKKVGLKFEEGNYTNRPQSALTQRESHSFETRQPKKMVKNKTWKMKKRGCEETPIEGTLLSAKRLGLLMDEGRSKAYLQKLIQNRRKAAHFLEQESSHRPTRETRTRIWI